jgi:mannosylglycerate hydrolase
MGVMDVMLVSHTHWDREWYRRFESFRARLVDTIDLVLDQLAVDPDWSFLLDGQTVVIEDYLAVRPSRRAELDAACRAGRLGIGPWYVQPDSLLPSGEAHVRNLLEGRRVGEEHGPVSTVGYTPDSFGHPAQFPQLFAGFGINSFVYWRGNGSEIDDLPPAWWWVAPDGTRVLACHLAEGYFAAAYLGPDVAAATDRLEVLVGKLHHPASGEVLLMNGLDHAPPDTNTGAIAASLAARTGWTVRRGLLDEHVTRVTAADDAAFSGELIGGRVANLLPGVWSTRLYLKQRNRLAQSTLEGWAEPFAAVGRRAGLPDERPSIRTAWRTLLVNQAHDSICGCSVDSVHEQMIGRYDTVDGLAAETTTRMLERLSGMGLLRHAVWKNGMDVAVWNPSPHPRTDVVRIPLDTHPVFMIGNAGEEIADVVMVSLVDAGVTVDGRPARIVVPTDPNRFRMLPSQAPWDVEFVAEDVPAFGWRRYRLAPGPAAPPEEDDGRRIESGDLSVEVASDGTLVFGIGPRHWAGLFGVEDTGDRGDTYDYDPVDGSEPELMSFEVSRSRFADNVSELHVRRLYLVPASLVAGRQARESASVLITVDLLARLVPGTGRLDVDVTVDNSADDHRLRLQFPVGATSALASTTFDVVPRHAGAPPDGGWVQPATATFPHQGWVSAGGLAVVAPDLPEAEITGDGAIAVTLIRAVGWLSGMDLHSRPIPAGPGLATPGAQCHGRFTTRISLLAADDDAALVARRARDAELGLRAVAAGPEPLVEAGRAAVELSGKGLVLSALKPAEEGGGVVVRVLNLSGAPTEAVLRFRAPVAAAQRVRLDEKPTGEPVAVDGSTLRFPVAAHALATVLVE